MAKCAGEDQSSKPKAQEKLKAPRLNPKTGLTPGVDSGWSFNPNAFREFVRRFVPEGPLTIAQRFNAGMHEPTGPSPEGTAESPFASIQDFSRPFGTGSSGLFIPALKRRAILTMSLRDKVVR